MPKKNGSGSRRPAAIIALCLTIVAMLWTALRLDAQRMEEAALEKACSDSANLAIAFRENIEKTVSALDQLMLTIIAENNRTGPTFTFRRG